jgi:hypothetical protein
VTVVRRRRGADDLPSLEEITALAEQKEVIDAQIRTLTERSRQIRDVLDAYAAHAGALTAKGHRRVEFARPITVGGKTRRGYTRQRMTKTVLDYESLEDLAKERGFWPKIVRMVEEIDQERVPALVYEGDISKEELDALLVTSTSYAIKGY